ncbi:MAG: type II secretion system F family protein [Pusillimonas sp.]
MTWVVTLAVFCAAGVVAWIAQGWFIEAFARYREAFRDQADVRLAEVFLFLDGRQLWVLNVLVCTGAGLVVGLLSGQWVLAVVAGLCTLGLPTWLVRRARARRRARFDAQLPDLLLALAGALRAGSGVQSALRQVVVQFPAPLSQEFGLLLREQRMGVAFDEALAQLSQRLPTDSTRLVVSALTIALHNGGNLAETLERIALTLRARLHLLGRIDALTSQGRMQAWVMAALPLLLGMVLYQLEPEAMGQLWGSFLGWVVIAAIVLLELAGVLMIRRIVNIRV